VYKLVVHWSLFVFCFLKKMLKEATMSSIIRTTRYTPYLLLALMLSPFAHGAAPSWQELGKQIAPSMAWSAAWSTITCATMLSKMTTSFDKNILLKKDKFYAGLWGVRATPPHPDNTNFTQCDESLDTAHSAIACGAALIYHGLPLWQRYRNSSLSKGFVVQSIGEIFIGCLAFKGLVRTPLCTDIIWSHTMGRALATVGSVYSYVPLVQRYAPGRCQSFSQAAPWAIGCSLAETALLWGFTKWAFPKADSANTNLSSASAESPSLTGRPLLTGSGK
jgi:hypothetical protein